VVGNNPNRKLNPREFRGFVLSDELAPLVFVNGADYKSAQMFTFFHEIAHLYLAKSGVVDIDDSAESHGRYEVYCNKVAAAALLPRDEVCDAWRAQPADDTLFTQISRRFKVSPIVVGRRLMDLEVISREIFFDFYARYTAQPFADPDASDGGNFYNNQNNRIGKPFMRAIGRAAIEGKISFTHAFKLTGLSSATFDRYLHEVGGVD
jgi:Zn-dependent peptidase ImmA (M78 family)